MDYPFDWELEGSVDSGLTDYSWGADTSLSRESGNDTMIDYMEECDLVWADRGEVDGVSMGVLVPIHLWQLRLRDWEAFGVNLVMSTMQEFWDTAFPSLAPVSTTDMWMFRRNMLDYLGLPHQ